MPRHIPDIAAYVTNLANERVRGRSVHALRWDEDYKLYKGDLREAVEGKRSTFVMNSVRVKVKTAFDRAAEILFPANDRAWGVEPTPTPSGVLRDQAAYAAAMNAMEQRMADVRAECRFEYECRRALRQGIMLGTAVVKGPMLTGKRRRFWTASETGEAVMVEAAEQTPCFWYVNIRDFFPDPTASSVDDSEETVERHALTQERLEDMAEALGFSDDALKAAISLGPTQELDGRSNLDVERRESDELRRFTVWEYHGRGRIVHVCNGKLLREVPHPLDSGAKLYSVYTFDENSATLFGDGLARIMKPHQDIYETTWRAMIDNAVATTAPMQIIYPDAASPLSGDYGIGPNKVYIASSFAATSAPPVQVINIPNNQQWYANTLELVQRAMDMETGIPALMSGTPLQAGQVRTTGGANAILQGAATSIRGIVSQWDNQVTIPCMTRLYEFLMQFSTDNSIKGDFNVVAKGTAILDVREQHVNALSSALGQMMQNPEFRKLLRNGGVGMLRDLFRAYGLRPDEFMLTDGEISNMEQTPPPTPADVQIAQLKAQTDMQIAQLKAQTDMQIAQIKSQTDMATTSMEQETATGKTEASRERNMLSAQRAAMAESRMAQQHEENIQHAERMKVADITLTG